MKPDTMLLWYDSTGDIDDRVARAARCYQSKHGRQAARVMVNAEQARAHTVDVDGVAVRVEPWANVLTNHFLVAGS